MKKGIRHNSLLAFTVIISLLAVSCNSSTTIVQKRKYRPGYHINAPWTDMQEVEKQGQAITQKADNKTEEQQTSKPQPNSKSTSQETPAENPATGTEAQNSASISTVKAGQKKPVAGILPIATGSEATMELQPVSSESTSPSSPEDAQAPQMLTMYALFAVLSLVFALLGIVVGGTTGALLGIMGLIFGFFGLRSGYSILAWIGIIASIVVILMALL